MQNQSTKTTTRERQLAREVAWSCFMYIALFGFKKKQMIKLQGVNRVLYKRLAHWMQTVLIFPTIKLSQVVCPKPTSFGVLVFPTRARIEQWRGVLHYLTGFVNGNYNGSSWVNSPFLSNGDTSQQRDERGPTGYVFLMPAGSPNKIRSVSIYYGIYIQGFSFFDKEGALLWGIGNTESYRPAETVLIAENEMIIGVVCKLDIRPPHWLYTDF